MVVDNFKKYMAIVLMCFGTIANVLGLFNAIYRHNGLGSVIPTSISIVSLLVLFILCWHRERYDLFIILSTAITGMLYFPFILMGTRNPQTFIMYTYLIPVSYGIGVVKKRDFILPFVNLALMAILIYIRIDVNYSFIYTIIYTYSFVIPAFFAIALTKYTNNVQIENKKYKKMAERDELTRLYNRHHLQSVMDQGEQWIPIMMDIDHFKDVNDTYGHDEGDNVLQQLASILLRFSNDSFMVFRYGGEEFLILSKMSDEGTTLRAKELFEAVRRELHTSDRKPRTISMGIGRKNVLSDNSIKRADLNLYYAKDHGRNCIAKEDKIYFS